MVSVPYYIKMRVKDEERTHRSRPETHFAMLNPSWRLEECEEGGPETELTFFGSKDYNSGLFAARTPSGENTRNGTEIEDERRQHERCAGIVCVRRWSGLRTVSWLGRCCCWVDIGRAARRWNLEA